MQAVFAKFLAHFCTCRLQFDLYSSYALKNKSVYAENNDMKSSVKFLLVFFLLMQLSAQENIPLASYETIPDSVNLRTCIASQWLLQDVQTIKDLPATEYTDGTGKRFTVESIVTDDVLEIRITPYDTNFYSRRLGTAVDAEKEAETAKTNEVPATEKFGLDKNDKPDTEQKNSELEKSSNNNATQTAEKRSLPENLVPTAVKTKNLPQGTWILRRDLATGNPISITIYLRESSDVFIVLHPVTLERIRDKSLIDFCIFSAYLRRDVPIGFTFEQLYYTSLSALRDQTKSILPWEVFEAPLSYSSVEETSTVVAKKMHELVYMDDGAFDENAVPRFIQTGKKQTKSQIQYASEAAEIKAGTKIRGGVDGFGFVKWIVDGIIRPVAGSNTYISALKKPSDVPETAFTKPYRKQRELFFGLDWIRNLAAARLSLTMKKTVYPFEAGIDVNIEAFSFSPPIPSNSVTVNTADEKKVTKEKFAGYFKTAGYQIAYLKALLYYLAVTEPNNFYLASINCESGEPALRQYNHVAAIFPYFDILGNFTVDVYENMQRVPLETFIKENAGSFIALVRISAPEIGFYQP